MASLITYTKKVLIERIKKHIADGFPDASFNTTDNEVLLYVDQALAFNLIGQVYAPAKVEGNIAMPEAYLTTYLLPALQQNRATREWYTTLPQPPISLPLGYSVDRLYFADDANGIGSEVFLIKAKRAAYRDRLPEPPGARAYFEGSKVIVKAKGLPFNGLSLYVRMASTRTEDLSAVINMPDDAIEMVFNNVIAKLKDRLQLPKDIIADDISAGNKSS